MSILFDQLRISDDGKKVYIDIHVNKAECFDNMYLDSITIMSADQVSETEPNLPTEKYLYYKKFDDGLKEYSLRLTANDFERRWETDASKIAFKEKEIQKTLFFVYVRTKGTPCDNVPCTLDELTTLGVTFDKNLMYQQVMNYTRELADDCNIPVGFTDFILLWHAFKAAIETDHFIPAIKFWRKLFGEEHLAVRGLTRNCGCHG